MRASGERGCDSGEETGLIEAQKFAGGIEAQERA